MDVRKLEQMQGEHRGLGVLLVRAGQGAILAVGARGVHAVPALHDLEPAVAPGAAPTWTRQLVRDPERGRAAG